MAVNFLSSSSEAVLMNNTTDHDFGTGDFTICWWQKRASATGAACCREIGVYAAWLLGWGSGSNDVAYMSSSGSSWDIVNAGAMGAQSVGSWVHLALTRSGSTFTSYKDAVSAGSWSSGLSVLAGSAGVEIGRAQTSYYFNGAIADFRLYKGTALSVAFLKCIYESRGRDNITTNLVLRMNLDERPDATTVTTGTLRDISPKSHTISSVVATPTYEAAPFRSK